MLYRPNCPAPATPSWADLVGHEVHVTPRGGDETWSGVILANDDRTPADKIRISVTTRPSRPPAPGELATINPLVYDIELVPDDDQHTNFGPNGLPLYHGSIPRTALATVPQLKALYRRRPHARQQPIAQLATDDGPEPLFPIATSVPLSGRKASALEPLRTCDRCGIVGDSPIPNSHFGGRYCLPTCREDEAQERWLVNRHYQSEDASIWARHVRANPRALWIHAKPGTVTPLFVGRLRDGATLLNLPAVCLATDDVPCTHTPDDPSHHARAEVARLADLLASQRLIAWDDSVGPIVDHLRALLHNRGGDGRTVHLLPGAIFSRRYAHWLGLPANDRAGDYYGDPPGLAHVVPPAVGPEGLRAVRAMLQKMAHRRPTDADFSAARANQVPHASMPLPYEEAYGRLPPSAPTEPAVAVAGASGTDSRPQLLTPPKLARTVRADSSRTIRRALIHDPGAPPAAARNSHRGRMYRLADFQRWWPHRLGQGNPAPRPSATDWSPLYGQPITIRRPDGQLLHAVVLPPRRRASAHLLRIVPTDPASTPAQPLTIDPTTHDINPMPHDVDPATRTPDGLALYAGPIPHRALATVADLRDRHSARPGPRQRPIARHVTDTDTAATGRALYAIADAIPLTSTARAKLAEDRTCAGCAAVSTIEIPPSRYGPRYCPTCLQVKARAHWKKARRPAVQQASTWAQQLVSNNRAVWIHSVWGTTTPLLIGQIIDGTALVDLPLVSPLSYDALGPIDPNRPENFVRLSQVAMTLRSLARCDIIAWDYETATIVDSPYFQSLVGDTELTVLKHNVFEQHLTRWLALPATEEDDYYTSPPSSLMYVKPPDNPRGRFDFAVQAIHEMAAGDPSEERLRAARAQQDPTRALALTLTETYGRTLPPR